MLYNRASERDIDQDDGSGIRPVRRNDFGRDALNVLALDHPNDCLWPQIARGGADKNTRLYDLRHTHATLLMLTGVHSKIVSERLGHSSILITLEVYSHVLPNMQQEAAEKPATLLYPKDRAGSETAANNRHTNSQPQS